MKRTPQQFKEPRYLTDKWFSVFTLGHDEPGIRNWLDDGEKNQGLAPGYTEHSVEYYINEWRYRGKLVPDTGADAAFGCSYTFGYGVSTCWAELIGAVNCGINGASNDQITRTAISYCKTFNPKNIYVLWSFKERREHVQESGLYKFRNLSNEAIKQELKNPTWISSYASLMNDQADEYNYQKNKILLESFCTTNNINLHQSTISTLPKETYPLARDSDHPGEEWHINMAGIICQ